MFYKYCSNIYIVRYYIKQKISFSELDRKICFSTGVFIILISFIDIITFNIEYIRNNFILPYSQPIITYFKMFLKNLGSQAFL